MTTITWICFGLAAALSILSASLWVVIIHLRMALDEERLTVGHLRGEMLTAKRSLADFRFPDHPENREDAERELALAEAADPKLGGDFGG